MTGRHRRTVARSLLLGVAGVLGTFSVPDPAAAHTVLVASFPASGSVVQAPVSQVRLVFEEAPSSSPLRVVVMDAVGRDVALGSARIEGRAVVVVLGPVEPGRYRVSYRVAAGDDHPETGGFGFTVVGAPADAAQPVTSVEPARAAGAFPGAGASGRTAGGRGPWLTLAVVVLGLAVSAPLRRRLTRSSDDGIRP